MPQLNKERSGLLLHEDFLQNSSIWTPSPNGYENIEYDGVNGLRIKHSTTYKTITLEEPSNNYCFVCELDHVPIDANDIGGIIIKSNDTSYVECQSLIDTKPPYTVNANQTQQQIIDFVDGILKQYLDGYVQYSITDDNGTTPVLPQSTEVVNQETTDTYVDSMYPYMKISKNRGLYTLFASIDNKTWIEVGNTEILDANRIGFFLYSYNTITDTITNNSHFYVKSMTLYDNNYIVIDNINSNQKIDLRDSSGNLICDSSSINVTTKDNKAYIDTTLLPMPLKDVTFTIYQDGTSIESEVISEMFGGDIYSYWHNIKLSINQVEVLQNQIFDLGTFYHNEQSIRLDIYNEEQYDIENLTVSVTAYSVYYGGNETMGVSLYDEAETTYTFTDKVIIPLINTTESKSILFKLTDKVIQDFYQKAGEFRFKINIE